MKTSTLRHPEPGISRYFDLVSRIPTLLALAFVLACGGGASDDLSWPATETAKVNLEQRTLDTEVLDNVAIYDGGAVDRKRLMELF